MRKQVATLLTVAFLISISLTANAAVKPGTSCKKLGSTSIYSGKKYTCVKSGKKLVWNKGVVIKLPTQTSTPTTTPTPENSLTDASSFNPSENCKITSSITNSEHLGFPRPNGIIPTLGKHRTIALFVDFSDVPADQAQIDEWKNHQIPTFEKYIVQMSYGKLDYRVDIYEKFLHINKSVFSYNLDTPHGWPQKPNADIQRLFRDATSIADPYVDFSIYEFLNIVTPATDAIGMEGTSEVGLNLDGKYFVFGTFGPIREYLNNPLKNIWLLHESGHMMGLPHPYEIKATNDIPYPIWDVMGDGGAPIPEMLGWERFVLGWLSDSQILCLNEFNLNEYVVKLSSLSFSSTNVKLFVFKISNHEALVIENRLSSALSPLNNSEEGFLIYVVDSNIRSGEGAIKLQIIKNPRIRNGRLLGTLQVGEIIKYINYEIQILSRNALDSIFRITKV